MEDVYSVVQAREFAGAFLCLCGVAAGVAGMFQRDRSRWLPLLGLTVNSSLFLLFEIRLGLG